MTCIAKTGLLLIASVLLAAPLHAADTPPMTAEASAAQVLQRLLDGNQRFLAGNLEHPNRSPARRAELLAGQHPVAAILACSDSRSSPEIIFDQGLGDLFVVRDAGNIADQVALESIGYAVNHLGVKLIVVMGHSQCGAVTAAVQGHDESGELDAIMAELRPAALAVKGHLGNPVDNAIRENIRRMVAKIRGRATTWTGGGADLKVVGAYHDLATGKVELLPD